VTTVNYHESKHHARGVQAHESRLPPLAANRVLNRPASLLLCASHRLGIHAHKHNVSLQASVHHAASAADCRKYWHPSRSGLPGFKPLIIIIITRHKPLSCLLIALADSAKSLTISFFHHHLQSLHLGAGIHMQGEVLACQRPDEHLEAAVRR